MLSVSLINALPHYLRIHVGFCQYFSCVFGDIQVLFVFIFVVLVYLMLLSAMKTLHWLIFEVFLWLLWCCQLFVWFGKIYFLDLFLYTDVIWKISIWLVFSKTNCIFFLLSFFPCISIFMIHGFFLIYIFSLYLYSV